MLKAVSGGLFMATVFFVAGNWYLGTDRPAGLVTFLMGMVVLIYVAAALLGVPPGGRSRQPVPD